LRPHRRDVRRLGRPVSGGWRHGPLRVPPGARGRRRTGGPLRPRDDQLPPATCRAGL